MLTLRLQMEPRIELLLNGSGTPETRSGTRETR